MSPEAHTPDQTTPVTELNPWSKEAHDANVEANRPTADNPRMLDVDDATVLARFSEVPGEVLSGFVTGYYFEGDTKMNIVELSQSSREKRAAAGIDSATMIVPQSEIAPLERLSSVEAASNPREVAVENVGEKAVEATTISPDMDEQGRTKLSLAEIRAHSKAIRADIAAENSVDSNDVAPEVEKDDPVAEVAELPTEVQRAIRDYELYMNAADRSVQANGHNKDADEDRRTANARIGDLPTAMQDLAKRYYKSKYND